jgi:hypothetical protein
MFSLIDGDAFICLRKEYRLLFSLTDIVMEIKQPLTCGAA